MSVLGALLDVVLPPACAACGALLEAAGPFCAGCALATEPVPRPGCPTCMEPDPAGRPCPRCRVWPPAFVRARAAFIHAGPLARAVHRFKYEGQSHLGLALGRALAQAIPWTEEARGSAGQALVVPVPLHGRRLRWRGYDQAALLARSAAAAWRLPLALDVLARIRATARQVGLDEDGRRANVDGAFAASSAVRGTRVVLVDDVYTTGATARSAAHALRAAGAREVEVRTLARAGGDVAPVDVAPRPGADGRAPGL